MGLMATFAVVTGLSVVLKAFPSSRLVRPPGVFDERDFLVSCIRCRACVNVCPPQCLDLAHLDAGLQNVGTPFLATPNKYCIVFFRFKYPPVSVSSVKATAKVSSEWRARENGDLCVQCVKVCPTHALKPVTVSQFHMGTAVVHKESCLAWRYGSCSFPCIDACMFDAIKATVGPVVDATKCVGCNQCSYVCLARQSGPTGIEAEPS
jgi:ferredoxin-type protein NapG